MNQYNRTREIINQLTNKISNTPSTVGKHLLVVFTGTNINIEETVNLLIKGKGYGLKYDIVFTEAAVAILEKDKICTQLQPRRVFIEKTDFIKEEIINGIDGVIVPSITQNTAIKLSMGMQDELAPRLLWESLWKGIPLWMDLDGLYNYKGLETKSNTLNQMISKCIEQLLKLGVKKIENNNYLLEILQETSNKINVSNKGVKALTLEELTSKNKIVKEKHFSSQKETNKYKDEKASGKKVVLTERDILNHPLEVKEIQVSYGSIITPLAQDAAKARGIKLIKHRTTD